MIFYGFLVIVRWLFRVVNHAHERQVLSLKGSHEFEPEFINRSCYRFENTRNAFILFKFIRSKAVVVGVVGNGSILKYVNFVLRKAVPAPRTFQRVGLKNKDFVFTIALMVVPEAALLNSLEH